MTDSAQHPKIDRTMFMHIACKRHCEIAEEMAGEILHVVNSHGDIPTALAVGVLELVKSSVIHNAIAEVKQ